ncbi:polymorphic toxin-type HINT domain-containing protein [Streptomyces sp. NPDC047980]|uniref:polymorphic toxin-type HINT domain-containing protein n=1 Tax=Streptomyces sp. NPDC047980 TaxID=3365494 RepID=UPI00371CE5FF
MLLDRSRRTRGWHRGYAAVGKAARGLLPLALLAGLVFAAPAAADDPAPPQPSERERVLQSWKTGGQAVKAAAGAALSGDDDKVRAFLDTGQKIAEDLDRREAALTLVTEGGSALREAAQAALNGTPEQLEAFMKDGWKAPLADDQRVEAARVIESGGVGVREVGDSAMRGSIDDIRAFLTEGQYRQRDDDARVRVAQIEATGGPSTKRAAAEALAGSIDDIREFLAYGQHVSRAQDQEHATISTLAKQTSDAAAATEKAKLNAQENLEKAKTASELAKKEAAKAAAETKAAKNDAVKAADAARRAAESTRRAADAAKAAISAARAANAAAQTAALAAQNASHAALQASRAASKAWNAAASGKVHEAAAAEAEAVAEITSKMADSAEAARRTLVALKSSIVAVRGTIQAMTDAAQYSEDSAGWAGQAGVHETQAKAAAASARRHAAEARRTADVAAAYADDAALAAEEARDAARSSAAHALKAAQAARKAAEHAGDSQAAANQAKINADEALTAAKAAGAAIEKAKQVQETARKNEAEEAKARTKLLVNEARDTKEAVDAARAVTEKKLQEAVKLDSDFDTFATEAAKPDAQPTQIAAAGRKMALLALQVRGPWSKAAAEAALTGDDDAVALYAQTGWKIAEDQDEREAVDALARTSPYEDVRTGAKSALAADQAAVHAFLTKGQYQAAAPDNRIQVARISEAGGTGIKEAAQAALHDPDPQALDTFLAKGQYQARIEDYRVEAARMAEGGGLELKAAAEAALASPDTHLITFVESGQYRAKRRDLLTAGHIEQIQGIIATSSEVAARAYQDASLAAKAAADAQGHADQARGNATTADKYAQQAKGYAKDAKASADRARTSAAQAAESAATARKAESRARTSANHASSSAARAEASANAARAYAASAYQAAEQARKSAKNAGNSHAAVAAMYKETLHRYAEDRRKAEIQRRLQEQAAAEAAREKSAASSLYGLLQWLMPGGKNELPDMTTMDQIHTTLDALGLIPGVGEPLDIGNCIIYGAEGWLYKYLPQWGNSEQAYQDAGLACLAATPIAGWAASGAKGLGWLDKFGVDLSPVFEALSKLLKKTPSCEKNSFPAGTHVLMGNGSTKPIEQIRTGDYVEATDPLTGSGGARRVEATIYTPDDRDFTHLTLDTAAGGGTVTATDHHPFWSEKTQKWTDAADLNPGDTLLKADGQTAAIATVRHWKTLQPAYNLTVNDLHTYYVLAGETPVLVHNSSCLTTAGNSFPGVAHTLDEHVGISDARAISLAASKPGGKNSVFIDHQTAQQVADYAVAFNQTRINKWLRGSQQQLTFSGRFGANNSLGTTFYADGSSAATGNGYFIQLTRAKGHPGGFYISTLYPK